MFPVVDLNEVVTNCQITVAVGVIGATGNPGPSGTLTVTIKNAAPGGSHLTLTQSVTNLTQNLQTITIGATPNTGKIHNVTAALILTTGESSSDDEFIQLC